MSSPNNPPGAAALLARDAALRTRLEGGLERIEAHLSRLDTLASSAAPGWEAEAEPLARLLDAALAERDAVEAALQRAAKLEGGAPIVGRAFAAQDACLARLREEGVGRGSAPLVDVLRGWAAAATGLARAPKVALLSGSSLQRRPRWLVSGGVVALATAAVWQGLPALGAVLVALRAAWFWRERAELSWAVWPTHVELSVDGERRRLALEPAAVCDALAAAGVHAAMLAALKPHLVAVALLRDAWRDEPAPRASWDRAALHASGSITSALIVRGHALVSADAVWFLPLPAAQRVVQRCLQLPGLPNADRLPELLSAVPAPLVQRAIPDEPDALRLSWPAALERRDDVIIVRRADGTAVLIHR